MSSIMQVAIGQRKLVRQLLSDNPSALLQLVSDELEQGSRLRLSSPDAEINAYFSYIADHPFDDLPQTDHDLVMRVRSIRGLSALLEMDRRILIGNPNAVLFNVSNNVLFLACDAWYQPGIYDQIRQNYDYITGQLGKVNSQRLQRIEVYSCCKMIAESPASRMWLLLHLWEEAIINGTTVFVADVDEASGSIRDELVDLDIQLISDGNGQTRLFKHTSEFQILERPDGRYPVNTISEMYDKLQDTQMRMIRRRVTVEVLRALCVEWKDEALSTELQRWEALRQQFGRDAIDYILGPVRGCPANGLATCSNGFSHCSTLQPVLISLEQAAKVACKSKRTLENYSASRPSPVFEGSGTRPSLYAWADIRDWLHRTFPYSRIPEAPPQWLSMHFDNDSVLVNRV